MNDIVTAFGHHRNLISAIGRVVVSYGELEFGLALLVGAVIGDENGGMKAVLRAKGESNRIDVADGLVRHRLVDNKIITLYEETIGHMRYCKKLRNIYAHSNWGENNGYLVYMDLDDLSRGNGIMRDMTLSARPVDKDLVRVQEKFFIDVNYRISWLYIYHLPDKDDGTASQLSPFPGKLERPNLYIPEAEHNHPNWTLTP